MDLPSRILVTGGTGFIGRCLVSRLKEHRCIVRVLCRGESATDEGDGVETVIGDVQDAHTVRAAMDGVEAVFHLAAWNGAPKARVSLEELSRINVEGTRNVVAAAAAVGVERFVHFSSVKVLGETTDDRNYSTAAASTYAKSRLEAEQLVMDVAGISPFRVCCLRLPLVWGPGHRGNLYRMLAAIDRAKFPPLPAVSNRRSLVHVEDVVQAALLAASHPAASGKTYIVTDGGGYSGTKLYELLSGALGRETSSWRVPLSVLRAVALVGDAAALVYPNVAFNSAVLAKLTASAYYEDRRLWDELGYLPTVSLEVGLPGFIHWYREQSRI